MTEPAKPLPLTDAEVEGFHHQINSELLGRFLVTVDDRNRKIADLTAHNAALVEALKSAQLDLCSVVCENTRPFCHQPMCADAQDALAKAQEG